MRIVTITRSVVVPLSVVVLALAGLSAPPAAPGSMLVLVAVGTLGLVVLALTRWQHRSRRVHALAGMDDVLRIAKDDASDLARMGSDAG